MKDRDVPDRPDDHLDAPEAAIATRLRDATYGSTPTEDGWEQILELADRRRSRGRGRPALVAAAVLLVLLVAVAVARRAESVGVATVPEDSTTVPDSAPALLGFESNMTLLIEPDGGGALEAIDLDTGVARRFEFGPTQAASWDAFSTRLVGTDQIMITRVPGPDFTPSQGQVTFLLGPGLSTDGIDSRFYDPMATSNLAGAPTMEDKYYPCGPDAGSPGSAGGPEIWLERSDEACTSRVWVFDPESGQREVHHTTIDPDRDGRMLIAPDRSRVVFVDRAGHTQILDLGTDQVTDVDTAPDTYPVGPHPWLASDIRTASWSSDARYLAIVDTDQLLDDRDIAMFEQGGIDVPAPHPLRVFVLDTNTGRWQTLELPIGPRSAFGVVVPSSSVNLPTGTFEPCPATTSRSGEADRAMGRTPCAIEAL